MLFIKSIALIIISFAPCFKNTSEEKSPVGETLTGLPLTSTWLIPLSSIAIPLTFITSLLLTTLIPRVSLGSSKVIIGATISFW